jgi:predicted MFS family arabinose efflux permease
VGKAYVTRLVAPEFRATGLGVYHMSTGLASLGASVAAGVLWQRHGFQSAFFYGALMALLALGLFVLLPKRRATTG